METLIFVLIILALILIGFLIYLAFKVNKIVEELHENLSQLPSILEELKGIGGKINENLNTFKLTIENVNNLIVDLKVLPKILEEVGETIKDFKAFLKGQIESVTDEVKFLIEDTKETAHNVREVTDRFRVAVKSIDPLIEGIRETVQISSTILTSINKEIKKLYIELSALVSGIMEFSKTLKSIISFSKK